MRSMPHVHRRLLSLPLLLLPLLATSAAAQTVDTIDPVLKARIDHIAADVMKQRGVPSASVAIVQGGKIVYTHAYGLARIHPDKPATPEMRYSIGSIS